MIPVDALISMSNSAPCIKETASDFTQSLERRNTMYMRYENAFCGYLGLRKLK